MKLNEKNIAKITLSIVGCFLILTYWWDFGFIVAFGIIIVWGIITQLVDDYNKDKRLEELEKRLDEVKG